MSYSSQALRLYRSKDKALILGISLEECERDGADIVRALLSSIYK